MGTPHVYLYSYTSRNPLCSYQCKTRVIVEKCPHRVAKLCGMQELQAAASSPLPPKMKNRQDKGFLGQYNEKHQVGQTRFLYCRTSQSLYLLMRYEASLEGGTEVFDQRILFQRSAYKSGLP